MITHWYTINELSVYLNVSTDDIERMFITGMLNASICIVTTPLALLDITGTKITSTQNKHGIFEIIGYEKINWKWRSGICSVETCDLYRDRIRLRQKDEIYGFNASFHLSKDGILITRESIKQYESENDLTIVPSTVADKPAYFDPQHKYYSEELAIAVNVWLELYGNNKINTKRSHKEQIKGLLSRYDLSGAAIGRIATLVNPNKDGGAPPID